MIFPRLFPIFGARLGESIKLLFRWSNHFREASVVWNNMEGIGLVHRRIVSHMQLLIPATFLVKTV